MARTYRRDSRGRFAGGGGGGGGRPAARKTGINLPSMVKARLIPHGTKPIRGKSAREAAKVAASSTRESKKTAQRSSQKARSYVRLAAGKSAFTRDFAATQSIGSKQRANLYRQAAKRSTRERRSLLRRGARRGGQG